MDLAPLKAVVDKIESDVVKDLGEALVPAVLSEAVSMLPEAYKPLGVGIEGVLQPLLQEALASVLAKVPQV